MDLRLPRSRDGRHCGFFRRLSDALAEAVRITVRYDFKRDFGQPMPETRREYNARFGQPTGPVASVPFQAQHVWQWFWQLSTRRGHSAAGGPLAISWEAIRAWSELLNVQPEPVEIDMILHMDSAFMAAADNEAAAANARASSKPAAAKPKRRYPA